MASEVEICNSALNQLGAGTILSLSENSKNGRICNARFETIRDAVLRSHPWNCAIKRQTLAQDTESPAWGFTYQYTLPSDCLRILGLENFYSDYKIEGRKVLTNDASVNIIYVYQLTDPNEMDVLLRETISAALAQDIAYAVTANSGIANQMSSKYLEKIREAKYADATEGYNTDSANGPVDQIISDDYINSRF
jgi:hypothetical protein